VPLGNIMGVSLVTPFGNKDVKMFSVVPFAVELLWNVVGGISGFKLEQCGLVSPGKGRDPRLDGIAIGRQRAYFFKSRSCSVSVSFGRRLAVFFATSHVHSQEV
jgi:hypothetical protein